MWPTIIYSRSLCLVLGLHEFITCWNLVHQTQSFLRHQPMAFTFSDNCLLGDHVQPRQELFLNSKFKRLVLVRRRCAKTKSSSFCQCSINMSSWLLAWCKASEMLRSSIHSNFLFANSCSSRGICLDNTSVWIPSHWRPDFPHLGISFIRGRREET